LVSRSIAAHSHSCLKAIILTAIVGEIVEINGVIGGDGLRRGHAVIGYNNALSLGLHIFTRAKV
jgi:hypothetical protein